MMDIKKKVEYVKTQGQTRPHRCHWPSCVKPVPPAMYMCKSHWFTLPASLRKRIWNTFVPGQEATGAPTHEYMDSVEAVNKWIANYLKDKGKK